MNMYHYLPKYVEPSIRPDDSRYGENPNRLQRHTQFQVILKPDPGNSQDLFIRSLSALGINVNDHDIRFVEDNWESPVLGAWGLGWEIWMDGMEITQFTYFQQVDSTSRYDSADVELHYLAGSLQLSPISVEITYGLERILMLLQGVDHFKKIQYADGITYGELFAENEKEMSAYYLEHASVQQLQNHFDLFEAESRSLLSLGLAIPAYDQLLKTSHAFNILDSRGFVGVTERARYFGRMRSLARQCAQLWLKARESLGYPLGIVPEPAGRAYPEHFLETEDIKMILDEKRSFVLEIGTEELPPHDVVHGTEQLESLMLQLLDKQRLGHGKIQVFGTPRRLVVLVEDLCSKQSESEVEVRGPPVSKAFDGQGNPTKAAEGFCRRYNVSLDSLFRKIDGKTEYVHSLVKKTARQASEILSEDLPGVISKLSFPKSMRWNSQVMFSRPVRWIMALHGDTVVPFTFVGVLSGSLSYGLRNSPSTTIQVGSAESYASALMTAGINIDIEDRKKSILEQSNLLAKSVDGHILVQKNLLSEVVNLVEAPVPVLGKFKESFLELPDDLLTMVMQKHQKYFAITDDSGKLLPYFITVANGPINEMVVREGNEAVLRARYEDAKFFYEMDTRRRLSEFQSQLKGILFHEKLGTMLDKVVRMQHTVGNLSLELGNGEVMLQTVKDAMSLAMSDLATAVVTEFTALSGIMARHYALRDGYSEQIAEALFEITLPRFSGDILPKSDVGIVLAIADRLDSLVGLFAAGCQPSSTNDPFGLRRISYGLVQILVEREKYLDLRHAITLAAAVQPIPVDAHMIDEAHAFVTRRLEQFLVDKGINSELVRSVLAERGNNPYLAAKTVSKMKMLSEGDLFPKVVEAYSRPTRIVRGKDFDSSYEVDATKFETNEERALWNTFLSTRSKIHPGIEVDEFVEASSELVQPLEDFFNNVFVMVEDESIRNTRLALLQKIADLPRGIADLSVLPGF
ncbi:Glycine--tRNA ligase, chloroplastic/mitochondrial 2 [Linum perenne]